MALTKNDLFLAGRSRMLVEPGGKFSREVIDTEGTDVNILLNVLGSIGEEISLEGQSQDNARYLATAASVSDEAVERIGFELTSGAVLRKPDTAAVVHLQFTRNNTFGLTIGKDYVVTTATTGVPFRLLEDCVWNGGDNTPKTVLAICENTGTTGNVDADTITTLSDDVGDTTVTVTNDEPAAGGREEESIIDFTQRVRGFFINQARGTLSAIEFGAEQVPEVAQATATEVSWAAGSYPPTLTQEQVAALEDTFPAYRAKVAIADVNGQANAALADKVREELQEWRAAGVPVQILGTTHQYITVSWVGLGTKQGYSLQLLLDDLFQRCIALVAELGPEETLERAALFAAAKNVEGLLVPAASLAAPADDITPATGYTLRLRREDISHTA